MSCNTCTKSFSFLRKEHGCPGCGYSYCSSCLKHKVFLKKLNAEAKVCSRCSTTQQDAPNKIIPPDVFLKRLQASENIPKQPETSQNKYEKLKQGLSPEDQQIAERLRQLKEGQEPPKDDQILERLKKLRGDDDVPKCSDDELRERLAKLSGQTSRSAASNLPPADLRSDQEKSEDLIRRYMEEAKIDSGNEKAFGERIKEIQDRLHALSGKKPVIEEGNNSDSETEEDIIRRIIEKAKKEAELDGKIPTASKEIAPDTSEDNNSELPWCEICNEDAVMRCLGCRYLFCRTCFNEHKDDDDGCDRYELYTKPKNMPA